MMTKKFKSRDIPAGVACVATLTDPSFLDGEETYSEVWWTLRVRFPGGRVEEHKSVFLLNEVEQSDSLIRELDVFGVQLEHADELFDALYDAEDKTAFLSAPPDAEGRCADAALPRRRWRPTAAQIDNRPDNYGFDRDKDEYGESRYVPRADREEVAVLCPESMSSCWAWGYGI